MENKPTKEAINTMLNDILEGRNIRIAKDLNLDEVAYEHQKEQLRKTPEGFYQANGSIYKLVKKKKQKLYEHGLVTKKSAFTLTPIAEIIETQRNQKSQTHFKFKFLIKAPHEEAKEFTVSLTEINKADKFDEIVNKLGTYLHSFTDKELNEYLLEIIQDCEIETIYKTKNPGYNNIENSNYWVTENQVIKYKDSANKPDFFVELSDKAVTKPKICDIKEVQQDERFQLYVQEATDFYKCQVGTDIEKHVMLSLLYYIEKAYNSDIKVFLLVSLAILYPYLNFVINNFKGFPIGYLEGDSATGKSNLLEIIAHLFGLDKTCFKSGNDTPLSILHNINFNSNIPMLIPEIGYNLGKTINEMLIKPSYDQIKRAKMKRSGIEENITELNTSIIIATNTPLNKEEGITNRLFTTIWRRGSFSIDEAERYNNFTKYLSLIIPYIIQNAQVDDLKKTIDSYKSSERLKIIKDERNKANISIVLAGFNLLIETLECDEITMHKFEDKINEFIGEYEQNIQDDELERFFLIIRLLLTANKQNFSQNLDYKIITHNGERGIHIFTGKKAENFVTAYKNLYKSTYGTRTILSINDYLKLLEDKYNIGKVSANYLGESRYGVFIPYTLRPEIEHLMVNNENTISVFQKETSSTVNTKDAEIF